MSDIMCVLEYIWERIAIAKEFLATYYWLSLFSEKPIYKIPIGNDNN